MFIFRHACTLSLVFDDDRTVGKRLFFRPVGGTVGISIVPGGKVEIPKSAG